jgi:hypothetical protein
VRSGKTRLLKGVQLCCTTPADCSRAKPAPMFGQFDLCKAPAANSLLSLWVIAGMGEPTVSTRPVYDDDLNGLVVTHSRTKNQVRPASTAYVNVNSSGSFRQGHSTRASRPLATGNQSDCRYWGVAAPARGLQREVQSTDLLEVHKKKAVS